MSNSSLKFSERHYHHDERFIVLQVEEVLYKLPASVLMDRCQVFADILSIPTNDGVGSFNETPMVVPFVSAEEADAFFDYLFPGLVVQEWSPNQLESILKLSNFFRAQTGRQFAINQLEHNTLVPSARLLRMSCEHRVPSWFKGRYRELIYEFGSYNATQRSHLNLTLLRELVISAERLDVHRRKLAFAITPSSLPADNPVCIQQLRCRKTFCDVWQELHLPHVLGVRRFWTDSAAMHPLDEIFTLFRENVLCYEPADICSECAELHFSRLKGKWVREEEAIVSYEVERIYAVQNFAENEALEDGIDPNM